MALTEQEEFELLSLEREKAMGSGQQVQEQPQQTQPEPAQQPQQNVLSQLMQGLVNTPNAIIRGTAEPFVKAVGSAGLGVNDIVDKLIGRQQAPEYNMPFPGGDIPIRRMQSIPQAVGLGLQGGAMAFNPAVAGAAYMGGGAMEEGKGPLEVVGRAALGGIMGKGAAVAGGEPLIRRTQKQLDTNVRSQVEKSLSKIGVKPTPSEGPTANKVKGFFDKANEAVKIIYNAKDNLKYIDDNGITSTGLPRNTKEFAQAIEQTKKMIYDAYDSVAQQTTGQGVKISLANIADDVLESTLKPEITDLHPEIQEYALKLSETLAKRGSYTPKEAQAFIKTANETLKNYYTTKHPDYVSKAYVEAVAADGIRKSLDNAITGTTGVQYQTLKNQYGALSTIEKQVNRAAVTSHAKKIGLLDYFEIYNIGDITTSILTGNLPGAAMGVGRVAVTEGVKRARSSEFITKDLFKKVSGVENYKRVNETRSVLQGIINYTDQIKKSKLSKPLGERGSINIPTGEGKVIKAYHGTDTNFENFSFKNIGMRDSGDGGMLGDGIYATGTKGYAKQYGKNVMPVDITLKNPLIIKDAYAFGGIDPAKIRKILNIPEKSTSYQVRQELIKQGYDGIILNEITDNGIRKNREVVALYPNQVTKVKLSTSTGGK